MQVYAGVETLTNQPSAAERAAVPHHLVGYLPLDGSRARSARTRRSRTRPSTRAAERGALPLVVGGTGLYLRAALADLALPPPVPAAERARWERVLRRARRRARAWPSSQRATRARPGACTPTTAAASCARSSSRSRERACAGARPPVGRRHAAAGARRGRCPGRGRSCARASRRAPRPCSPAERVDEVRALRERGRRAFADRRAHPRARADRRAPRRRATLAEVAAEITLRTRPVRAPAGDLGA